MGRHFDECPCTAFERSVESAIEAHHSAQVPVPVLCERGAGRHHLPGRTTDELHWSINEFSCRQAGEQFITERLEDTGVDREADGDLPGEAALSPHALHRFGNRVAIPCHRHRRTRIDHREFQPARRGRDQRFSRLHADTQHRDGVSAGKPVHHTGPGRDDCHGVGQRDRPGDVGCAHLAETVSDREVR